SITLAGAVHEFNPQQRVLFIGEGSNALNNVDFLDISAFRVTGEVIFEHNGVESGSEGVQFFVDGTTPIVDSDGLPVSSDANGQFEVMVPIGYHSLVVRKPYHNFQDQGRWPNTPGVFYDFQDNLSGIKYVDQTRRIIIGRVAGGTREGNKKVGFGLSNNNIGTAKFRLVSQDNIIDEEVNANPVTGEYRTELPPKLYSVYRLTPSTELGINVKNNPQAENFFTGLDNVDLTQLYILNVENEEDDDGDPETVESTNTTNYHLKRNYIFRSDPLIRVVDEENENERIGKGLSGEDSFTFESSSGETDEIDLSSSPNPIYLTNYLYGMRISVEEVYTNRDTGSPVEDHVPVTDATLTLTNYLGKGVYKGDDDEYMYYETSGGAGVAPEEIEISRAQGDTLYVFMGNNPNTSLDSSIPENSFTRTLQITATAGGNLTYWPNPSDLNDVHRAYLFGARALNSSFVTQGPEMVDFILRDPPGTDSSTTLSQGETLSFTHSTSLRTDTSISAGLSVGLENETFIGIGAAVLLEATATFEVGVEVGIGAGFQGEWVSSYTTTTDISTSDDLVGAEGDIFVGSSKNYQYGASQSIGLFRSSDCGTDPDDLVRCPLDGTAAEVSLLGASGTEYQVASSLGLFLNPIGNNTTFIYTQDHIESKLLPALGDLRNNLLLNHSAYSSKIAADHPLYGSNNDDSKWTEQGLSPSTSTPTITEAADFDGPSYTFVQPNSEAMDSIRWFNQQIRLWEEALSRNEEEKLDAIAAGGANNISLSAGTEYASSSSYGEGETLGAEFELAVGVTMGATLGANVFGAALEATLEFGISITTGYSFAYSTETETTYEYTLSDGDIGDFLSVDIYTGEGYANSPIFVIKDGGETSCPHEEAYVTKYYMPGTEIGATTRTRELPRLEVRVAEVFNVPADEEAIFVLILNNDSETNEDVEYSLQVVNSTNPHGASFKIDGAFFDSRRSFEVPGGGAIQKILSMERGPYEYDYEDIEIVMSSTCDDNLSSSINITAHFQPSCTLPELRAPKDNWVLNYELDHEMDVVIGSFDINYGGFEKIDLRYRPKSATGWITLETFYKDSQGDPDKIEISQVSPNIEYTWNVENYSDGAYDLVVVSYCNIPELGLTTQRDSEVYSGIIDRINPHPFGVPQPADGILSPGDEIMVQFNERINEGRLISQNFEISGILNGGTLRHPASIFFDGSENNYMQITGIDISQQPFSIDFYARRIRTGRKEVMLSQGEENSGLSIGFDAADLPFFALGDQIIRSETPIQDDRWHHYALPYVPFMRSGTLSVDALAVAIGSNFTGNYEVTGDILLSKTTYTPSGGDENFRGNIHELRIWNRTLSPSDVNIIATQRLSRSERGLLSNWRMEEVEGQVAHDHIRSRDAAFLGTWQVEPGGRCLDLNNNLAYAEATPVSFGIDNDFTIEFWFHSVGNAEVTLFSNGRGDVNDLNVSGWSIGIEADGTLVARNQGGTLRSLEAIYHDNLWHHVGLISRRIGNTILVIDGTEQNSIPSKPISGFAGPKLWIGARGWFVGAAENIDNHFAGEIDDLRIWESARTIEQIQAHRFHRLSGDERGLLRHYPFEDYEETGGIWLTANSLDNETENSTGGDALTTHNTTFGTHTPMIKIPLPKSNISFNYSSNRDKIILSPTEAPDRIENVILDITVENVQDIHENKLLSPITWSAYVDRNQVVWSAESKSIRVPVGETVSFEIPIQNMSGELQNFEISNLPHWIQVSPTSGPITPLSQEAIQFNIRGDLSIGQYTQDIYLRTEFGYNERLNIEAAIYASPPQDWILHSEDYAFSMSIIGQLQVNGEISRDPEDLIIARAGDEIRGKASLEYIQDLDAYYVFLAIYSHTEEGDELSFEVWNASHGRVQSRVSPIFIFAANALKGSIQSPIIFDVPDFVSRRQELKAGWQWISFHLSSPDLSNVNQFLTGLDARDGDLIKNGLYFDQYDGINGWIGTLTESGGLNLRSLYKLKLEEQTILDYEGNIPSLEEEIISLVPGWNWIGYVPQRILRVETALSNLNPQVGDQIKGQRSFAVYAGSGIGWVGSLESMDPGSGYMYQSAQVLSFHYPSTAALFLEKNRGDNFSAQLQKFLPDLDPQQFPNNMTLIIEIRGYDLQGEEVLLISSPTEVQGFGVQKEIIADQSLFFATVWGDQTKYPLQFELLNKDQKHIPLLRENPVQYQADLSVGSLNEPLILYPKDQVGFAEESNLGGISIQPNPVKDKMILNLHNPEEEIRRVELIGLSGNLLANLVLKEEDMASSLIIYLERYLDSQRGVFLLSVYTNRETYILKIIRQ
ncbi:MAG: LamG domain-containing protein, partial [Cytophagales bacterium]|nr:LamG domain-containing protein [Cytophagales bacterium]